MLTVSKKISDNKDMNLRNLIFFVVLIIEYMQISVVKARPNISGAFWIRYKNNAKKVKYPSYKGEFENKL